MNLLLLSFIICLFAACVPNTYVDTSLVLSKDAADEFFNLNPLARSYKDQLKNGQPSFSEALKLKPKSQSVVQFLKWLSDLVSGSKRIFKSGFKSRDSEDTDNDQEEETVNPNAVTRHDRFYTKIPGDENLYEAVGDDWPNQLFRDSREGEFTHVQELKDHLKRKEQGLSNESYSEYQDYFKEVSDEESELEQYLSPNKKRVRRAIDEQSTQKKNNRNSQITSASNKVSTRARRTTGTKTTIKSAASSRIIPRRTSTTKKTVGNGLGTMSTMKWTSKYFASNNPTPNVVSQFENRNPDHKFEHAVPFQSHDSAPMSDAKAKSFDESQEFVQITLPPKKKKSGRSTTAVYVTTWTWTPDNIPVNPNTIPTPSTIPTLGTISTQSMIPTPTQWSSGNTRKIRNEMPNENLGYYSTSRYRYGNRNYQNYQNSPGGNQNYPGGNQNYPGGNQNYPGGNQNYPGGNQNYPGGNQNYPGGNQNYPGGNQNYPGGNQNYQNRYQNRNYRGNYQNNRYQYGSRNYGNRQYSPAAGGYQNNRNRYRNQGSYSQNPSGTGGYQNYRHRYGNRYAQGNYSQNPSENQQNRYQYNNYRSNQNYANSPGGYNRNQYQNQGTYNQNQGTYNQNQGTYSQNRGPYNQNQGSYNQNQGSYKQNQSPYNQNQGPYNQNQGSYNQNQGSYNQNQYNSENKSTGKPPEPKSNAAEAQGNDQEIEYNNYDGEPDDLQEQNYDTMESQDHTPKQNYNSKHQNQGYTRVSMRDKQPWTPLVNLSRYSEGFNPRLAKYQHDFTVDPRSKVENNEFDFLDRPSSPLIFSFNNTKLTNRRRHKRSVSSTSSNSTEKIETSPYIHDPPRPTLYNLKESVNHSFEYQRHFKKWEEKKDARTTCVPLEFEKEYHEALNRTKDELPEVWRTVSKSIYNRLTPPEDYDWKRVVFDSEAVSNFDEWVPTTTSGIEFNESQTPLKSEEIFFATLKP